MENQKHNGWNNYETWLTALWIDNEWLVEQVKEEHQDQDERENCLAVSLKDWIEEQNPLAESASLFADLINSALSKVDWHEIAENFLTE